MKSRRINKIEMIATQSNIVNPSLLSQINFHLKIKRAPNVNYFCTKINLPGCSCESVDQATPFVNIPEPGDHLVYNPLRFTFNVDEDFRNWIEIHSWMRKLSKADDFEQYKSLEDNKYYTGLGLKSEVLVSILNSSRNANFNVIFSDCFPVDLSDTWYDVQAPDVQMVKAEVVMRYTDFSYENQPF